MSCLMHKQLSSRMGDLGLPWWLSGKESTCQTGDAGSMPGSGRSPGGGSSNPLQYSCLEILCAEEADGLQSMASQRSRHVLVTKQQ